jgi:hypothetical protein
MSLVHDCACVLRLVGNGSNRSLTDVALCCSRPLATLDLARDICGIFDD